MQEDHNDITSGEAALLIIGFSALLLHKYMKDRKNRLQEETRKQPIITEDADFEVINQKKDIKMIENKKDPDAA